MWDIKELSNSEKEQLSEYWEYDEYNKILIELICYATKLEDYARMILLDSKEFSFTTNEYIYNNFGVYGLDVCYSYIPSERELLNPSKIVTFLDSLCITGNTAILYRYDYNSCNPLFYKNRFPTDISKNIIEIDKENHEIMSYVDWHSFFTEKVCFLGVSIQDYISFLNSRYIEFKHKIRFKELKKMRTIDSDISDVRYPNVDLQLLGVHDSLEDIIKYEDKIIFLSKLYDRITLYMGYNEQEEIIQKLSMLSIEELQKYLYIFDKYNIVFEFKYPLSDNEKELIYNILGKTV